MKFGPVPASEAAGAYLAHSIRLDRRTFKKGRLLSPDDIEVLVADGVDAVTVARLEDSDVHEDKAAARLAIALAGSGLKISTAFTGRVNLIADCAGILTVDADCINRINAVHESVTVATLAPYASVSPRQMAATIKIIPFAAPEWAVAEAEAIAKASAQALVAHPYRLIRAALILSLIHI